jgi:hypothetical protein
MPSAECQLLILRIYAKTKNTQRRCKALQENRYGKSEAVEGIFAPHPDFEGQETQNAFGWNGARKRCRYAQSKADDSVLDFGVAWTFVRVVRRINRTAHAASEEA